MLKVTPGLRRVAIFDGDVRRTVADRRRSAFVSTHGGARGGAPVPRRSAEGAQQADNGSFQEVADDFVKRHVEANELRSQAEIDAA